MRWSEVLDGRGQCLEQSVAQGSASVALAGVAHKIKLEPEELNFGVVFIGNSREREVTIKNEGTTTITLETPNTTLANPSYFSIVLAQNPLVLGPGQSGKVSVRFTATVSGTYAETARLLAGTLSLEIPLLAAAMHREGYIQAAIDAYNAIVQIGG
ncbi:MAG: choice-of-anchor D domain-containing protein, partial [Candidatus Bipolaricaulota bacterium]|nr:choice-of-anchor D domain-containing protein [Candidatus Bipolaricaulota bacterium]